MELFRALGRRRGRVRHRGWCRNFTAYGPLDVLTLPAHLGTFADVHARAHSVRLGDLDIAIAHRDDLLTMKRAAGRPQDLADVRLLESLGDEP